MIQPRVAKSEEERKLRARKMAEVFTPSWICNNMNNGVDERWFNRKPVFNIVTTEKGKHLWTPTCQHGRYRNHMWRGSLLGKPL